PSSLPELDRGCKSAREEDLYSPPVATSCSAPRAGRASRTTLNTERVRASVAASCLSRTGPALRTKSVEPHDTRKHLKRGRSASGALWASIGRSRSRVDDSLAATARHRRRMGRVDAHGNITDASGVVLHNVAIPEVLHNVTEDEPSRVEKNNTGHIVADGQLLGGFFKRNCVHAQSKVVSQGIAFLIIQFTPPSRCVSTSRTLERLRHGLVYVETSAIGPAPNRHEGLDGVAAGQVVPPQQPLRSSRAAPGRSKVSCVGVGCHFLCGYGDKGKRLCF
ncbi:hypothetical protein HDK90DRAFT_273315, partial [Phyllosticta capitalensis]